MAAPVDRDVVQQEHLRLVHRLPHGQQRVQARAFGQGSCAQTLFDLPEHDRRERLTPVRGDVPHVVARRGAGVLPLALGVVVALARLRRRRRAGQGSGGDGLSGALSGPRSRRRFCFGRQRVSGLRGSVLGCVLGLERKGCLGRAQALAGQLREAFRRHLRGTLRPQGHVAVRATPGQLEQGPGHGARRPRVPAGNGRLTMVGAAQFLALRAADLVWVDVVPRQCGGEDVPQQLGLAFVIKSRGAVLVERLACAAVALARLRGAARVPAISDDRVWHVLVLITLRRRPRWARRRYNLLTEWNGEAVPLPTVRPAAVAALFARVRRDRPVRLDARTRVLPALHRRDRSWPAA